MDNNNNSNMLLMVVLGIAALAGVFFVGNWLMDRNDREWERHDRQYHNNYRHHGPYHQRPYHHSDVDVRVQPHHSSPYQRRYHYPQHHTCENFWHGYWDGYYNRHNRASCSEYSDGYRVGRYDRSCGNAYYYNDYCPASVRVNVPGFRFELR